MLYLGKNLRYLRKQKQWTQADLATKLNVNRSLIGAYEEGRSEPRLATLITLCEIFRVTVDELLQQPLENNSSTRQQERQSGQYLRILPVVVDGDGREGIPLVPQKAAAGYTRGYADMEFIEQLPIAHLPLPELQHNGTQRLFQIEGDSMLPLQPGTYILGSYVDNWQELRDYQCYIIITRNEGIVFKRLRNELRDKEQLWLMSDNPDYQPYPLPASEILEIWLARGSLQLEMPNLPHLPKGSPTQPNQDLHQAIAEVKQEITALKAQINKK